MRLINTKSAILLMALLSLCSILVAATFLYPVVLPTGSTSAFLPFFFRLGGAVAIFLLVYSIIKKPLKNSKYLKITLLVLALIFQIIFLLTFARPVYTDTGYVMTMAGRLVSGNHNWYQYFYIYPNNVNVVIWWSILFKPLSWLGINNFFGIYPWIQMLMLDFAIVFLTKSLEIVNKKISLIFLFTTLYYVPLFMYAIFPYNDVVAVALIMVVIGCFVRYQNVSSIKNKAIIGTIMLLAMALAVAIRQNSAIILIALVLTIFFSKNFSKKEKSSLIIVGLVFALLGTATFTHLQKTSGFVSKPSLVTPSVRYVNMSWNPNTHGQIDGPDSFLYAELPKDERTKKINAELKHRIKILGLKGSVVHLVKKVSFMFSLGFSNQDMGGMQVKPPLLKYEWQAGELSEFIGNLFQPVYILITSFASFALYTIYKKRDVINDVLFNVSIFSSYSIVGIYTFHILFWEVRDRYAVPMFPFFLILAVIGLYLYIQNVKDEKNKFTISSKSGIKIGLIAAILLLLGFGTSFKHSQEMTGRGGAVYTSGFSMYTEEQKELATIKANSIYKTDSFELQSPANTLYLNYSKLTKEQTKNLNVTLINQTTKQSKKLAVENKEMTYLNTYQPGKYELIIQNTGSEDLKTPILQSVDTDNIQGPKVSENGKVVRGLNTIFSFADNVSTKWISLPTYITLHLLFIAALLIAMFKMNILKMKENF